MFPTMDLSQALAPGEGEAYWLIGTLVTIKVAGELTGNALSVTEHLVPVGGGLPPHLHHVEDEILYVLEGEIAGHCGSSRCGPGQAARSSWRGVAHAWRAEGDCPARLVIVRRRPGLSGSAWWPVRRPRCGRCRMARWKQRRWSSCWRSPRNMGWRCCLGRIDRRAWGKGRLSRQDAKDAMGDEKGRGVKCKVRGETIAKI